MRDKVECAWCIGKLTLYLQCELAEDERARIRRHLEACPDCHGELGGYFLLDRWEANELPTQEIPAGFTVAIIERLPDRPSNPADRRRSGAAVPARRVGGFNRRALLGNYLVAAAATLILVFTNAFGIFTDLAARADRLNAGARDITIQTQRLVEAQPHWLDILKSWFPGNKQPQEGSKKHAQE